MNAFSTSKPENGKNTQFVLGFWVLMVLGSLGFMARPAAWGDEPSSMTLRPIEAPSLLPVDSGTSGTMALPVLPKESPREAVRESQTQKSPVPVEGNRQVLSGKAANETTDPSILRLLTAEPPIGHCTAARSQVRLLMGEMGEKKSGEQNKGQNKAQNQVQGNEPPAGSWCFAEDVPSLDARPKVNDLAGIMGIAQPKNTVRPEKINPSNRVVTTRYDGPSEHSYHVQQLLLSPESPKTSRDDCRQANAITSDDSGEKQHSANTSKLLELLDNGPVRLAQTGTDIPRVMPSPHAMLPPDPAYDDLRTSGRPSPFRNERREVPPPRLPPRHLPDEVIPGEQPVQAPPAHEYEPEEPSDFPSYELPYETEPDWGYYPDLVPGYGPHGPQRPCMKCPGAYQSCRAYDPWAPRRLLRPRMLACRDITIGGWVDQGISAVGRNPVDRYNGPVTFNDRCGEYQMNQLYMFVEREVCTGGRGLDFGGRIDVLYGTDARFVESVDGLEASWGQAERFYQVALPQFYLDVGINNVTVRMGHFYKIMGYEEVTAPSNFFYSHSYAFQYGEPKTQTGMLVFFDLEENLSLTGGFSRGIDQFDDTDGRNQLAVLAAIDWTSYDERRRVRFGIDSGEQGPDNITTIYSLVGQLQITDRLQWILEHNYGQSTGGNRQGVRKAEWYGLSQYVLYQLQDAWQAGVRIEWFCDEDGTRVRGLGEGNLATGPFVGNFYELTLGLNWQPHPNVMLRPEVRWDWYHRSTPTGVLPYDSGEKDRQFLYGFDLITQF